MIDRRCKRCSASIGPRVTLCDACRAEHADQAWRAQGQERRSVYQEIDIDRIAYTVGIPDRDERYDEDFRAVDVAVSRWLQAMEVTR